MGECTAKWGEGSNKEGECLVSRLSSVHPKGLMFGKGGWSIQFSCKGHLNRQKG
jgi:hypothetical protein